MKHVIVGEEARVGWRFGSRRGLQVVSSGAQVVRLGRKGAHIGPLVYWAEIHQLHARHMSHSHVVLGRLHE